MKTREFAVTLCTRDDASNSEETPESGAELTREIEGLAVPYGVETEIVPGWREVIAAGAVTEPEDDTVKLFSRHRDPIGVIVASSNDKDGYRIRARISQTPLGDETLTLLRDGVVSRLSIGFEELEFHDIDDERGTLRTQTQILVREVSVVPFPAYQTATVTNVRHHNPQETPMDTTTLEARLDKALEDVADMRRDMADRLDTLAAKPVRDERNAGAFLLDLARGDEATRATYEQLVKRAWDGTKLIDDAMNELPMWTKNLVATYDAEDYIGRHFASAALGATGMTAEFLRLKTNTLQVAEQTEEGTDLVFGKMSTQTDVARVKTFGGYTSISVPEADRGSASLLSAQLTALAQAAGYASAAQFEKDFAAGVKASTNPITLAKGVSSWKWADVTAFLIDAAQAFHDAHLPLTGWIVDVPTFKALAALTDAQDNPRMPLTGTTTPGTQIGSIDLAQITGTLGSLTVQPHWNMKPGDLGTGVTGAMFSSNSLVRYQTALVQLQDTNVVNLTRQWSVYRYGMNALERPDGLVPVKVAA